MDAASQLTYLYRRRLGKVGVDSSREWFEEQLSSVHTVRGSELLLDDWVTPPAFVASGQVIDKPDVMHVDGRGAFATQGSLKLLYREQLCQVNTYPNVFTCPKLRFAQPQYGVVVEHEDSRLPYDDFELLDDVVVAPPITSGSYSITVYVYSGRVGTNHIPQLRSVEPIDAACLVLRRDEDGLYLDQQPITGSGTVAPLSDDVVEGTTNLFFTAARCRQAVSNMSTDLLQPGLHHRFFTVMAEQRVLTASLDQCKNLLSALSTSEVKESPSAQYFTKDRVRDTLRSLSSDDVAEGHRHLYFTDDRVRESILSITADDISEGGEHLYFTKERVHDEIRALTADALSEGHDHLYYTDDRVRDVVRSLTADDIGEGDKHSYYTEDRVHAYVSRLTLEDLPHIMRRHALMMEDVASLAADVVTICDDLSDTKTRMLTHDQVLQAVHSTSVLNLRDIESVRAHTTDDLREGRQLFFTEARARAAFDDMHITLDDVADGTNRRLLTATDVRVMALEISRRLDAELTTDGVHESPTRQYFTSARVTDAINEFMRGATSDLFIEGRHNAFFTEDRCAQVLNAHLATFTLDKIPDGVERSLSQLVTVDEVQALRREFFETSSSLHARVDDCASSLNNVVWPKDYVRQDDLRRYVDVDGLASQLKLYVHGSTLDSYVTHDLLNRRAAELGNRLEQYMQRRDIEETLSACVRRENLSDVLQEYATVSSVHDLIDNRFVPITFLDELVSTEELEHAMGCVQQAHRAELGAYVTKDEVNEVSKQFTAAAAFAVHVADTTAAHESLSRDVAEAMAFISRLDDRLSRQTLDDVVDGTRRTLVTRHWVEAKLDKLTLDDVQEGRVNKHWKSDLHTDKIVETGGYLFWTEHRARRLVENLTLDSIRDGQERKLPTAPSTLDEISDGLVRRLLTRDDVASTLASLSTSDVHEGANLYMTRERVQSIMAPIIASLTTDDVCEGSRKYFDEVSVVNIVDAHVRPEVERLTQMCHDIHLIASTKTRYDTNSFRRDVSALSTADIKEHSHRLFLNEYTLRRVLRDLTTDDLAEGSRSYFSLAAFSNHDITTNHIREGSNLYYTDERALFAVHGAGYVTNDFVAVAIERAVPTVENVVAQVKEAFPTIDDVVASALSRLSLPTADELVLQTLHQLDTAAIAAAAASRIVLPKNSDLVAQVLSRVDTDAIAVAAAKRVVVPTATEVVALVDTVAIVAKVAEYVPTIDELVAQTLVNVDVVAIAKAAADMVDVVTLAADVAKRIVVPAASEIVALVDTAAIAAKAAEQVTLPTTDELVMQTLAHVDTLPISKAAAELVDMVALASHVDTAAVATMVVGQLCIPSTDELVAQTLAHVDTAAIASMAAAEIKVPTTDELLTRTLALVDTASIATAAARQVIVPTANDLVTQTLARMDVAAIAMAAAAQVIVPTVDDLVAQTVTQVNTMEIATMAASQVVVPTMEELVTHTLAQMDIAAIATVAASQVILPTADELVAQTLTQLDTAAIGTLAAEQLKGDVDMATLAAEAAAQVVIPTAEHVAAFIDTSAIAAMAVEKVVIPTDELVAQMLMCVDTEAIAAAAAEQVLIPSTNELVGEVLAHVDTTAIATVAAELVVVPTRDEVVEEVLTHVDAIATAAAELVMVPTKAELVDEMLTHVDTAAIATTAAELVMVPTTDELLEKMLTHVGTQAIATAAATLVVVPTKEEVADEMLTQVDTAAIATAAAELVMVPSTDEMVEEVLTHVDTAAIATAAAELVMVPSTHELVEQVLTHVDTAAIAADIAAHIDVPTVDNLIASLDTAAIATIAAEQVVLPSAKELVAQTLANIDTVAIGTAAAKQLEIPSVDELLATTLAQVDTMSIAAAAAELIVVPTTEGLSEQVLDQLDVSSIAMDAAKHVVVPSVDEIAAQVPSPFTFDDILGGVRAVMKEKPRPASDVALTSDESWRAIVTWSQDIVYSPLLGATVRLLAGDDVLAEETCDTSARKCTFDYFPVEVNLRASVTIVSQAGESDATFSNIVNIIPPVSRLHVRSVSLVAELCDEDAFDAVEIGLIAHGTVSIRIGRGNVILGCDSLVGNGTALQHTVRVCGTAEFLDVVVACYDDNVVTQLRVNKPFQVTLTDGSVHLMSPLRMSPSPLFAYDEVEMTFVDHIGCSYSANRYRTPRDSRGNVISARADAFALSHRFGKLNVVSSQIFAVSQCSA